MRFFEPNTVQSEYVSIVNEGSDKLIDNTEYPILRERQKYCEQTINRIERATFYSTNSPLS